MTSEDKLARRKALRDKRLAAGACTRCGKARTAEPGHTSEACAPCAERVRTRRRTRYRAKRGTPIDAPVKYATNGGRGPSPDIPRTDEYDPDAVPVARPRRKASEIFHGSLTLDEIRRATSALPLKPPGK